MGKNGTNKDLKKPQSGYEKGKPERLCHRGRQSHTQMLPSLFKDLILDYGDYDRDLQRYKGLGIVTIQNEIESWGFEVDRRTIYKYIDEINLFDLWERKLSEYNGDYSFDEAIEDFNKIKEEGSEREKLLIYYDKNCKEYFPNSFDEDNQVIKKPKDQRADSIDKSVIAECIYSSRFLSEKEAERLVHTVTEGLEDWEKDLIDDDAWTVDRIKTKNLETFDNIRAIKKAMFEELQHVPCKIKFNYQTNAISDVNKPILKKEEYIVNPFQLLIDNGNYYLIALTNDELKPRTFRVDRIRNIKLLDEDREGWDEFNEIDLTAYTTRRFSMFDGEEKTVTMSFRNQLLDAVIDRFGTQKPTTYEKIDEDHFRVTTEITVSNWFFSWICGFDDQVVIETPEIASDFKKFLNRIQKNY